MAFSKRAMFWWALDLHHYTQADKIDGKDELKVIANTAYSYATIVTVARKVAQRPEFKEHKLVRDLKFSDKGGWLRWQVPRRWRVAVEEKTRPPIEVIRADLQKIQQKVAR